jgi:hypothetical protein
MLGLLYFAGLIMFGIAVGSHCGSAEYGFMIVGIGTIAFSLFGGLHKYLNKPYKPSLTDHE